ncbi:hypothetical protein SBADM41S_05742 [Streptomyces badius]
MACAPGDRDEQARRHGNFGHTLRNWADVTGDGNALRESVDALRKAVDLATGNSPHREQHRATLGSALCLAADRLDEPALRSEGIALLRTALREPDAIVADRAALLSDLGVALFAEAVAAGGHGGLHEEGVAACRLAADTAPNVFERTVYLINLGLLLSGFAEHAGRPDLLDEACATAREALDGAPDGHPLRSRAHFTLSRALDARYTTKGSMGDLDEAVTHARWGADLAAVNLGALLINRAQSDQDPRPADEARRILEEVIAGFGADHPSRPFALQKLATASVPSPAWLPAAGPMPVLRGNPTGRRSGRPCAGRRPPPGRPSRAPPPATPCTVSPNCCWRPRNWTGAAGDQVDLAEAAHVARDCARSPVTHLGARLRAAQAWGVASVHAGRTADGLEAYAYAVGLLPRIAHAASPARTRRRGCCSATAWRVTPPRWRSGRVRRNARSPSSNRGGGCCWPRGSRTGPMRRGCAPSLPASRRSSSGYANGCAGRRAPPPCWLRARRADGGPVRRRP